MAGFWYVEGPACVSGMLNAWLTSEEALLVAGYRGVKQQGQGTMYLELAQGKATRWEVRPDFGGAKTFNEHMGKPGSNS